MKQVAGRVLPFDGMITADAYLWAKYIDDAALQKNLKKITQNSIDNQPWLLWNNRQPLCY